MSKLIDKELVIGRYKCANLSGDAYSSHDDTFTT